MDDINIMDIDYSHQHIIVQFIDPITKMPTGSKPIRYGFQCESDQESQYESEQESPSESEQKSQHESEQELQYEPQKRQYELDQELQDEPQTCQYELDQKLQYELQKKFQYGPQEGLQCELQGPQDRPQEEPRYELQELQYAPQEGLQYGPQQEPQYAPQEGLQYGSQEGPQYAPQEGLQCKLQGPQEGLQYASQGGQNAPQEGLQYAPQDGLQYAPQDGLQYAPQEGLQYEPQEPQYGPQEGLQHELQEPQGGPQEGLQYELQESQFEPQQEVEYGPQYAPQQWLEYVPQNAPQQGLEYGPQNAPQQEPQYGPQLELQYQLQNELQNKTLYELECELEQLEMEMEEQEQSLLSLLEDPTPLTAEELEGLELGWSGNIGTLSSPWTPTSVPALDTNGAGSDRSLDVSDDDKDLSSSDAEGVWSPDIEQSFQEALAIYPPCGRRKIILSDEGKMYGRNELIARYIKLRTGKTRTRKQVSSHIQVLARRKMREIQAKLKQNQDQQTKDTHKALQTMSSMSSAQIVSATAMHNKATAAAAGLSLGLGNPVPYTGAVTAFWQAGLQPPSNDVKPFTQAVYGVGAAPGGKTHSVGNGGVSEAGVTAPPPGAAWEGRAIATNKLCLVEFSAFMDLQQDADTYQKHMFVHIGPVSYTDPVLESVDIRQIYDKFPEKKGGLKELYDKGPQNAFFLVKFWADLNSNIQDESRAFYAVTSQYEGNENMTITCSTKVCSFGKQVVEKVETEYPRIENGRFVYRIARSPMCEYMINFIHKLKHLPEKYMMNSVLENFTILQVVTHRETQETLLCIAYVFEVSSSDHGAQHHIYKLVKE